MNNFSEKDVISVSEYTTKQTLATAAVSQVPMTVEQVFLLIIDICNTFIIPFICFLGIITNALSIIIFSNQRFRDLIYKYLLVNSISNMFYLLNCFFIFVPRCGRFCTFSSTEISQYFYYIFYTYLKGIPAILTIGIQIICSLYRYTQITNNNFCQFTFYKVILFVLVVFSAIFYSPIFFTKSMSVKVANTTRLLAVTNTNQTLIAYALSYTYSMVTNDIGKSTFGKVIIIVISVLRGFISLIILVVINLLTNYQFKKLIARKEKLTAKKESRF